MNEDISRRVIEACCDLFGEVRSYSGRGMYGARCVGLNCDGSPMQDLAKLVLALCEQGPDGMEAAEHLTRDGAVQTDSMGRGSILYFPRLPFVDARAEGEDEAPCSEPADSAAASA